ncbi:hypothetical protein [Polaromonas sp. SM01]|uniref:hypothetical protein n=1 Tax=Polaromonas sp. SM01 TaxID=3085630 RepID=UPI0029813699|nr:hypothetical protein [Polaromonas sp. SM01]MDW5443938.1 hypothetical protein [Polaromonas sp. SM01]
MFDAAKTIKTVIFNMHASVQEIFEKSNKFAARIVASKYYQYLLRGVVMLQLALLVLSLLYTSTTLFFYCLKALLAISVVRIFLERFGRDRYWPLNWLIIVPGLWGAIYGFSSGNIGARSEFALFVMAPIVYLLVFHRPAFALLSLKYMEPALKAICAANLLVFYFLFFTESGSLRALLEAATLFRIQFPDGYTKVYTLQITPLIFLLPVMAAYYYFKQSWVNFLLFTAALLMALLSGRKAILVLFTALSVCTLLCHVFRHRDLRAAAKLVAPWALALVIFPQIAAFERATYVQAMFNSFPELGDSVKRRDRQMPFDPMLKQQGAFANLYALRSNACAMENYLGTGLASDKLGAVVRQAQITTLVKEVAIKPWFGKGLGYVTVDCIRSEQQPWRFELTYLGMALHIGLVGISIFALVYLRWVKKALSPLLPRQMTVPLLCGSVFFVICSASNAYILSVEYLWIFFIPFLLSRWLPEDGAVELECVGARYAV